MLTAPPGAGKTVLVPAYLRDDGLAGEGEVLVLQPRRVAARSAARFLARCRGAELGGEVGYQVRFERRVSEQTRIRFITEGVLTRRLQADPFLDGVSAVVLDEFHERSLDADLALALLREVRDSGREDLRLIVMSATLEAEPIAAYLGGCPILRSAGRQHPVDVRYLSHPDPRFSAERVAAAVRRIAGEQATGHLLAFLPGAGEIRRCTELLEDWARERSVDLRPLYGALPAAEQDAAITPGGRRRVILATNIAETSLTVEGVTAVVDSGEARRVRFDPGLGNERLERLRISQASAEQRAGRAGRLGPGVALRTWTRAEHAGFPRAEVPEIRRVDLTRTVLELAAWGHVDPAAFAWFEAPPPSALSYASQLLLRLGAVDAAGHPTALGRALLALPLHPRLGVLLRSVHEAGYPELGARLVALCAERDPLRESDGRGSGPSDLRLRLELWERGDRALDPRALRTLKQTAGQLQRLAARHFDAPGERLHDDEEALGRALLRAFPDRVARRRAPGSPRCRIVGGRGGCLAPSSVVRDAELFVAVTLTAGNRAAGREPQVRLASAIEARWLEEVFPEAVELRSAVIFDEAREAVSTESGHFFLDLCLEARPAPAADPAEISERLAQEAAARPERALKLDGEAGDWLARLRWLRGQCPELALPDFDDAARLDIARAAAVGHRSFDALRRVSLVPLLENWLGWQLKTQLDALAPTHLTSAAGSRIRLRYPDAASAAEAPVMPVKLQEMFGVGETPRVADGRVPVLLHLLAPNQRPVQVTRDLASFWERGYPDVRKDLRGRYPKHPWPENPWEAPPQRGVKRRR